jgi:sulfide:quinone oxidoreductase
MAETPAPRTVILGGGIAAIEALLALDDLAGGRTRITLISPTPEFLYKPLTVEEPFTHQPAESRALEPLVSGLGGRFVRDAAESVNTHAQSIDLTGGSSLPYDHLIVCAGAQAKAALENAETFRAVGAPLAIDDLIDRALAHPSRRLAFLVPPGVSWTLPIYELALMTRTRAERRDTGDLRLSVVTPEELPLAIFGRTVSDAVSAVLAARGIEFRGSSLAADAGTAIAIRPGGEALDAGAAVALPVIQGRRLRGLPSDANGFIPIDDHARIIETPNAYAAGDGTNFPIKQGGLATQQADAAAASIAAALGAAVEPESFHPVLRGQLIVGAESLNLEHDVTGEGDEGRVSSDYLWWPPHKVSGRYLAPWLAGMSPHADPAPPERPIEVEIAMPHDWHTDPMALDPYSPLPED